MEVKVLQRPARGRPRAWRNLPAPSPGAGVRYGVVFLIILTLLIFELVAPAGNLERVIAVALAGAASSRSAAVWLAIVCSRRCRSEDTRA